MIPPSISATAASKRAGRLSTVPDYYRGLFKRIYSAGTRRAASPRERIKAFCLECIGFKRDEITTCTAYACPLWDIRPYQHEKSNKSEAKDAGNTAESLAG